MLAPRQRAFVDLDATGCPPQTLVHILDEWVKQRQRRAHLETLPDLLAEQAAGVAMGEYVIK